MKEINKILPAISLILTAILAGFMIMLYKEVKGIERDGAKPMVCIPLVKEDYYGDHYFLECLDRDEFNESFEKAEDPEI